MKDLIYGNCPPPITSNELVGLSDEELCRNAQQGCVVSRDLLWYRNHDFVQRVIWRNRCRLCLPPYEMADALQAVYCGFHKAVQKYDPKSHGKGKFVSFKTFLCKIVADEFSNYRRGWKRYHQRIALNLDDNLHSNIIDDVKTDSPFINQFIDESNDSVVDRIDGLLSEHASERLADIWKKLKPKEIELLAIWLQFGNDRDVARILDISPAAAKQRRERLFQRIKNFSQK